VKNYATTHFGDIDRYKKYLGHSREGVNMRVMQDDKVVVMEKTCRYKHN
jgi:hypothetical protein